MVRVRALAACGLALMVTAAPATADIIRNKPSLKPGATRDASDTVRGRLVELGVDRAEADQIVSRLRPEEVEFFNASPGANGVVGQEDTIVMFWYEWVLGIAYAYGAWSLWDHWGCESFFPDRNANGKNCP